ncbi:MAG TPA: hypothetical protein VGL72_31660 [Bryobacteraceae bacterium]|jgi:cytochrome oxidase Cu insertion factor (SCO1/SenC/PrrC family)
MKSLIVIVVACLAAAYLAFAAPQASDQPPAPTIHAETRVVQIDVVATDSHGKPVTLETAVTSEN